MKTRYLLNILVLFSICRFCIAEPAFADLPSLHKGTQFKITLISNSFAPFEGRGDPAVFKIENPPQKIGRIRLFAQQNCNQSEAKVFFSDLELMVLEGKRGRTTIPIIGKIVDVTGFVGLPAVLTESNTDRCRTGFIDTGWPIYGQLGKVNYDALRKDGKFYCGMSVGVGRAAILELESEVKFD